MMMCMHLIKSFYCQMNYLAEMLRDCSKNRPATFTDLSFSIIQDIENKIKNKNSILKRKFNLRLKERNKPNKNDERREDISNKKDGVTYARIDREPVNYIEAFEDPRISKDSFDYALNLPCDRVDEKEEQINFNIYFLLRKRRPVFKTEEIKRKLRTGNCIKRGNMRDCECCGRSGKHKCSHIYCDRKCWKLVRYANRAEPIETEPIWQNEEPEEAVLMAQRVIDSDISENKMMIVQIKQMDDEMIHKIDQNSEEQRDRDIQDEVIQRQRISEIQSKSEVSQSRRNKSSHPSQHIREIQQHVAQTDEQANPKHEQQQANEQNIDI